MIKLIANSMTGLQFGPHCSRIVEFDSYEIGDIFVALRFAVSVCYFLPILSAKCPGYIEIAAPEIDMCSCPMLLMAKEFS